MKTEFILTVFFVYLIFVAAMTVIPTQMSGFRNPDYQDFNLVPIVNSIKSFMPDENGQPKNILIVLANLIGNIVLFVPLGFLLPLALRPVHSLKRVLGCAFALSLSIETIQFFSRFFGNFRVVDIDDILLNTFGAALGFWFLCLFRKRKTLEQASAESNGQ